MRPCRPLVGARFSSSKSGSARTPTLTPKPFLPKSALPTDPPKTIRRKNNVAELSALAARLGHKVEDIPSLKLIAEEQLPPSPVTIWPTGPRQAPISAPLSRLAVLGRSTMMHYLSEYLYFAHPTMDGSMLRDLAGAVTDDASLFKLSSYIGATDLMVGIDEDSACQVFCAVVGSIFKDLGPKSARKMVHDFVVSQLAGKDLDELIKLQHPHIMLCSILASQGRPKPIARLISESGRTTHFPSFVVGVYSDGDLLGEGTGTSLKRAEKEAMITSLRSHFQKELLSTPLPSDLEEEGGSAITVQSSNK